MRTFDLRKAISAVTATAMHKVAFAAQPLVLTPLMLNQWGADRFGEWVLINSIAVIVLMFHSGLSQSSSADIIRASSNPSIDIKSGMSGALALNSIFAFATALIFAVTLGLTMPGDHKVAFTSIEFNYSVLAVLAIGVTINLFSTPVMTAIAVRKGASLPMLCATSWKILETVGCVLAIVRGGGAWEAAWTLTASALLMATSQVLLLRLTTGSWLQTFGRWCSWHDLRRLLLPSVSAFSLFFSSNVVLLHGTRVLIDGIFGPAILAATAAITTYFRSLRFLMAIVPHGLQVEIGILLNTSDADRSARIISRLSSLTSVISLVLAVMAFLAAPMILHLWTPTISFDYCLLAVVGFGTLFGCLFDFWSTLLSSVNRITLLSFVQLLCSAVIVVGFWLSGIKVSICWMLGLIALPDVFGVGIAMFVSIGIVNSPAMNIRSLLVPKLSARESYDFVRKKMWPK